MYGRGQTGVSRLGLDVPLSSGACCFVVHPLFYRLAGGFVEGVARRYACEGPLVVLQALQSHACIGGACL